ncbi:MAG: hypothetical protein JXB05_19330 [Myxococcaceae bacterium]|nr:hypothetical protein [Myxococcaceae bacterium]
MQQIECRCGNKISLSEIPVQGEFVFFPGEEWDSIVEALVAAACRVTAQDRVILGEALSDALAVKVSHFYRCSQCARLILSMRGKGQLEYYKEEG